jgi:hypothetical protein
MHGSAGSRSGSVRRRSDVVPERNVSIPRRSSASADGETPSSDRAAPSPYQEPPSTDRASPSTRGTAPARDGAPHRPVERRRRPAERLRPATALWIGRRRDAVERRNGSVALSRHSIDGRSFSVDSRNGSGPRRSSGSARGEASPAGGELALGDGMAPSAGISSAPESAELGGAPLAQQILDGLRGSLLQTVRSLLQIFQGAFQSSRQVEPYRGRVGKPRRRHPFGFLGLQAALLRDQRELAKALRLYDEALQLPETREQPFLLLGELVPAFQAQGVHAEAARALRLFHRAALQENLTAELTCRLVRYLYRARGNPEMRFAPS